MAGILSKGIVLGYSTSDSPASYTPIANVQSIPSLGGDVDQIETTCLENGNKTYIPGLKDFGSLEFGLLFDNSESTSNFRVLKGLETAGNVVHWQVEFPDAITASTGHGTQFNFDAKVAVSTDEAAVNAALTFKATMFLQSDISVVDPA